MAICSECGTSVPIFSLTNSIVEGRCNACNDARSQQRRSLQQEPIEVGHQREALRAERKRHLILTTETAHNLPVTERLGIVTAECVIGMHLLKDAASLFRDAVGGRSKVMQQGLRDARNMARDELKDEALDLGADAVVGVNLDYSEIWGGGKSMLFSVASGTAVKLNIS